MGKEKIKVESLNIIVTMIEGKPYYEIKYKEVGDCYCYIGYGSYNLAFVLEWSEQYFEVVENKDTKDTSVPGKWIPITERTPEDESYILVSFENATMVDIARYEEDDEGGRFYQGDDDEAYSKYGMYVNAWMPLPELYKSEEEKQNEADRRRHAEKVYDG